MSKRKKIGVLIRAPSVDVSFTEDIMHVKELAMSILQYLEDWHLCAFRRTCRVYNKDDWVLERYDFYYYLKRMTCSLWPMVLPEDEELNKKYAHWLTHSQFAIQEAVNRHSFDWWKLIVLTRKVERLCVCEVATNVHQEEQTCLTEDVCLYKKAIREREKKEEEHTRSEGWEWLNSDDNNFEADMVDGYMFEIIYDPLDGSVDMLVVVEDTEEAIEEFHRMPLIQGKVHDLIYSLDFSLICKRCFFMGHTPRLKELFKTNFMQIKEAEEMLESHRAASRSFLDSVGMGNDESTYMLYKLLKIDLK